MTDSLKIIAPERRCPVCGGPVLGRSDKIFCSEKCKNAHNNAISYYRRCTRKSVLSILDENYAILEELLGYGVKSVPMEQLVKRGFNIYYSTGLRKGQSNHEEHMCYDIAYYRTESRIFGLRRIKIK